MTQDKGKLVHAHPANELTEKQFGIESVIVKLKNVDATATTFAINSDTVDSTKIWKITHVTVWNEDGDIATEVRFGVVINGSTKWFHRKVGSTAQRETVDKHVEFYLDAGNNIRATFVGVAVGETCYLNIFGYEMNAP